MDPRLYDAARRGDTSSLQELLQEDSLILERGSLAVCAENALHIAALAGQSDFAKEIVTIKPELAAKLNKDGFSPIHMASANGYVEIVRGLLKINSELGLLKSSDGRTPLHFAATTGSIDVITVLLLKCPESTRELTMERETALHLAVKNNQFKAFKYMVEELKQCNFFEELLNSKDEDGNTVLYLATSRRQRQTIKLLLGGDGITCGKADVNATNKSGFTALDVLNVLDQSSCEPGNIVTRELLLNAGAVRARDIISPLKACPVEENRRKLVPLRHPPWKFWKALAKEVEASSMESQNAMIVVAVLITTVTYQAILSPPGGFRPPNESYAPPKAHRYTRGALMSTELQIFIPVTFLNSIGFFASLWMIILLTRRFPLKSLIRLAVLSMAATYVCVILYIGSTNFGTLLVAAFVMVALVLGYFIHFMRRLIETVRRVRREASADASQGEV